MLTPGGKRAGVCVAVLLGAIAVALAIAPAASTSERVIKITAERYAYEPDHITLKKGQPVVFELVSEDRMHGFNVPELHIRADVMPGVRSTSIPRKARRATTRSSTSTSRSVYCSLASSSFASCGD